MSATQRTASNAGEREAVPWDDAKQSELNDWFLSLPEGRQRVLQEDKWMLAGAAFQAGKASKPPAGEQKPVEGEDYYVSGPYVTGTHAGFHAVAELSTGRIVHFFKPDQAQPEQVAQDREDAERWRAFISLEYKVRAEWANNLSLAPVLTAWVDQRAARARGEGERS